MGVCKLQFSLSNPELSCRLQIFRLMQISLMNTHLIFDWDGRLQIAIFLAESWTFLPTTNVPPNADFSVEYSFNFWLRWAFANCNFPCRILNFLAEFIFSAECSFHFNKSKSLINQKLCFWNSHSFIIQMLMVLSMQKRKNARVKERDNALKQECNDIQRRQIKYNVPSGLWSSPNIFEWFLFSPGFWEYPIYISIYMDLYRFTPV